MQLPRWSEGCQRFVGLKAGEGGGVGRALSEQCRSHHCKRRGGPQTVSAVGAAEQGLPSGEKGPGSSAPTLSAYFIPQSLA